MIPVLLLCFVPLAVILYDVAALRLWGTPWTISQRTLHASQKQPIIAVLIASTWGFLMAHLFFPQY